MARKTYQLFHCPRPSDFNALFDLCSDCLTLAPGGICLIETEKQNLINQLKLKEPQLFLRLNTAIKIKSLLKEIESQGGQCTKVLRNGKVTYQLKLRKGNTFNLSCEGELTGDSKDLASFNLFWKLLT